ncbi:MAG: hypothetical protein IKW39_05090 [Alphaproteobacteria bacterium]|nr:hypothetical protein [Alphaproteobacteria bacterium]
MKHNKHLLTNRSYNTPNNPLEKNLKPLLITLKILLIGFLWSVIFIDAMRVVLLINWHFDIFLKEHWLLLKIKWNSGAPISGSEVIFFIIILSSFPIWLAGWYGLSLLKLRKWLRLILLSPLFLYRKLTLKTKAPVIVKKKTITEDIQTVKKTPIIKKASVKRPVQPSATLMPTTQKVNATPYSAPMSSVSTPSYLSTSNSNKKQEQSKPIDHALFNFDEEDFDLDFDFEKKETPTKEAENTIPTALVADNPPEEAVVEKTHKSNNKTQRQEKPERAERQERHKREPQNRRQPHNSSDKDSHTPVMDVLAQKGYDIISSAIIKNITVDYIAVSKKELLLCLVDRETGDWLADEENFNDEEPLWFSESSQRVSPVRKIDIVQDIIKTKLAITDFHFDVVSYVIIQAGNIINAEDMFDIWKSMNINVTRINRGSPKEIRLFSKTVENCEDKLDKNTFEKLKKLIYSMA